MPAQPSGAARTFSASWLDAELPHGGPLGGGVNGGDLLIGTRLGGAIDGVVVHDHARAPQEIGRAAVGTGNVELCNGVDNDGDGAPDDGLGCVRGTTETRTCARPRAGSRPGSAERTAPCPTGPGARTQSRRPPRRPGRARAAGAGSPARRRQPGSCWRGSRRTGGRGDGRLTGTGSGRRRPRRRAEDGDPAGTDRSPPSGSARTRRGRGTPRPSARPRRRTRR